ncbi:hypothetical protein AB7M17_004121 [Bradyrhizobium sp. USDA 377]
MVQNVLGDLERVRRRRVERQQRPIEPGIFMRLRHRLDVGRVENRPLAHDGLGRIVVADEADELDRHDRLPDYFRKS